MDSAKNQRYPLHTLPALPVRIYSLSQHPEWIPYLALRHQRQWPEGEKLYQGYRLKVQRFRSHLAESHFPHTFIALTPSDAQIPSKSALPLQLAGSVSLVNYRSSRAHSTSTWLVNLWVTEALRQQGIGSQLMAYAQRYSISAGVKTLYLSSGDKRLFYQKRQWRHINTIQLSDRNVVDVLCKRL